MTLGAGFLLFGPIHGKALAPAQRSMGGEMLRIGVVSGLVRPIGPVSGL